jgi:hypothetical protein
MTGIIRQDEAVCCFTIRVHASGYKGIRVSADTGKSAAPSHGAGAFS